MRDDLRTSDLAAEIESLRRELARAYETIEAMVTIGQMIASRVPFKDPGLPTPSSASLPSVAGGDARAYRLEAVT